MTNLHGGSVECCKETYSIPARGPNSVSQGLRPRGVEAGLEILKHEVMVMKVVIVVMGVM